MRRKIAAMHDHYGVDEQGRNCSDCCNFVKYVYMGVTYRKCRAYGDSRSVTTDWAGKYIGCGIWGEPFDNKNWVPLICVLRRKNDNGPVEGQTAMDGV